MKKQTKKDAIDLLITMAFLTFIFWIISHYFHISWVWILSPFWLVGALLGTAIIIAFIRTIFSIFGDYIKYLKEKKNGAKRNSKNNG
jgi:hypothetical protein